MMLGSAIGIGSARGQIEPWWPAGARYAADFTRGIYMRDGLLIPASEAFSFSRASSKIARGRDGSWTSFGVNVPCITQRGILLEPERQNTALNSTWFEYWGLVRAAVTPNGRPGIDGAMSADLITATASNVNGAFAGASSQTVTPGSPYTFSMIVERANSDWVALMATTADFLHRQTVWFNLATGAVGSTSGVGSEIALVGAPVMEGFGGGQFRVGVTINAAAPAPILRLYLCDGNGALTVAAGAAVWGLHGQVEGGDASSPIQSLATVQTRSADQCSFWLPTGVSQITLEIAGKTPESISVSPGWFVTPATSSQWLQRAWAG